MTLKIILSLATSFALVYAVTPRIIPYLKKLKFGQVVREEGPETHKSKSGTPTMGGVAILSGIILSYLLLVEKNVDSLVFFIVTIGFGAVGLLDDYIKVVKKKKSGFESLSKISWTVHFCFCIGFLPISLWDTGRCHLYPPIQSTCEFRMALPSFCLHSCCGNCQQCQSDRWSGWFGFRGYYSLSFLLFTGFVDAKRCDCHQPDAFCFDWCFDWSTRWVSML